ncbi:unnamed protein product [Phytophthora lilii]|uniref:Unnamed protein product n=1 Tax=Phytophthora lilii TaxID=2077276 RepID=A0A9W6U9N3_9STRA|nr:unnamed protein product [Phytophthora lilii]
MDRKVSWPAVSQISSFTLRPSTSSSLAPNSTPIVRSWMGWKCCSVNCSSSDDLPTSESPMMMYLSVTNTMAPRPLPRENLIEAAYPAAGPNHKFELRILALHTKQDVQCQQGNDEVKRNAKQGCIGIGGSNVW